MFVSKINLSLFLVDNIVYHQSIKIISLLNKSFFKRTHHQCKKAVLLHSIFIDFILFLKWRNTVHFQQWSLHFYQLFGIEFIVATSLFIVLVHLLLHWQLQTPINILELLNMCFITYIWKCRTQDGFALCISLQHNTLYTVFSL